MYFILYFQGRTRKKQTKDTSKGEHCPPVLYRHHDCIPDEKLLQSCDRYNLLGIKINPSIGCCKKSAKGQEINNQQNKIKPTNVTSIVGFKSKEAKITPLEANSTECNNDEVTKSRKRRIRKRRLLESLAPTLNNCTKPNPSLGNSLKTKLCTQISAQSSSFPLSSVIITNKPSEPPKLSPKDSRKRLDKSVGLRTKSSIKSKTLVESPLNQSKANLIKSLEGKALNSLLQTLAPLGNSSPNKDKTSSPKFSFPEKKINYSDNKIGKDGVFYFGETKHQLEKLASGLNDNSSSTLIKENPEFALKTKPNKNNFFSNNSGNTENCLSSFNFSPIVSSEKLTIDNSTSGKQKFSRPITVGKSTFTPDRPSNELSLSESSVQNLSLFPKLNSTSPALFAPFLSNSSIIDTNNIFVKANISTENIQNPNLSQPCITGFNKAEQVSVIERDNKAYINTMKSSEDVNKSNKTREEVMLEREAKKAAKMAAKTKHKNPQNNKADSEISNNIVATQKKELAIGSNKIDRPPHQESKDEIPHDVSANVHLEFASTDKAPIASISKDKKQESAGKSKAELRAERRAKQVSSKVRAGSRVFGTLGRKKFFAPLWKRLRTFVNQILILL